MFLCAFCGQVDCALVDCYQIDDRYVGVKFVVFMDEDEFRLNELGWDGSELSHSTKAKLAKKVLMAIEDETLTLECPGCGSDVERVEST